MSIRKPTSKEGVDLLKRMNDFGLDYKNMVDDNTLPHHPKSDKLVREIAQIAWMMYDDYFHFKIGGNGDNGDILTRMIDIIFTLEDKERESFDKFCM